MLLIRSLVLAIAALSSGIAIAQSKTPPTPVLGKQVTALADLVSDGYAEEFTDARTYHAIDIFGHGRKDAIVFFTLEGESRSVYYGFYLAVFENVELIDPTPDQAPRYRLAAFTKVGGKGWRDIDFDHVQYSRGQLKVITHEYAARDPNCCPSKSGRAIYRLQGGALREIGRSGR
jgi:hypothetical protein